MKENPTNADYKPRVKRKEEKQKQAFKQQIKHKQSRGRKYKS
jgi:hypothetical protein